MYYVSPDHMLPVWLCCRYYDEQGVCVETERFTAVQQYTPAQTPGSWDLQGDRGTTLGTNMYVHVHA